MGKRLAGVVTRAVVLTTSWRLCGPLFRLVNDVPLGNVVVPPVGAPEADKRHRFRNVPGRRDRDGEARGYAGRHGRGGGETATLKLFTTATAGGGAGSRRPWMYRKY